MQPAKCLGMEKPDEMRELFRMQKALNERIGVKTDGMSDEEKIIEKAHGDSRHI